MKSASAADFRLTVLNPRGHDPAQRFDDGASPPGVGHQPTNFHAYAACTRGSFERDQKSAIAANTPVLLLLRGDFKDTERALEQLQAAGRRVAVSLKETGLHQIAAQLSERSKFERFQRVVRAADGCIAPTPEAAELYRTVRGEGGATFIPTPYPLMDSRWDFSRPIAQRSGILIGTREFDVPSRNHLAALLVAKRMSDEAGASVTVYNHDGRRGAALLKALDFKAGQLRVLENYTGYVDYLRELASHRIVLQLDRSSVPGQVAGDALLCRVPCIGGNGAVDRIAYPVAEDLPQISDFLLALLRDEGFYARTIEESEQRAREKLSYEVVSAELENFFRR